MLKTMQRIISLNFVCKVGPWNGNELYLRFADEEREVIWSERFVSAFHV